MRTSIIGLGVFAALSMLYVAQDIAAPVTLGIVTGIIVSPIMDLVRRIGIPAGFGAMIILIVTIAGLSALAFVVEPLIWRVAEEIPRIRYELRTLLAEFQGLIQGIDAANEEMKQALGGDGDVDAEKESPLPSVSDALFLAPVILAQMLIFAGTFYFFLVTRLDVFSELARRIGGNHDAARIQQRFRTAEYLVSRYFAAISVVNAGLGLALAGYLSIIGLPLPLVWGAAAFLLNYVLYVGPAVVAFSLLLSGLINFSGVAVLGPMIGFMVLNMIEAQFVTPAMVGRHVSLNPLLVFLALVFGIWFWGPIGGIVAIPVVVIVVALLDDVATHRRREQASET